MNKTKLPISYGEFKTKYPLLTEYLVQKVKDRMDPELREYLTLHSGEEIIIGKEKCEFFPVDPYFKYQMHGECEHCHKTAKWVLRTKKHVMTLCNKCFQPILTFAVKTGGDKKK